MPCMILSRIPGSGDKSVGKAGTAFPPRLCIEKRPGKIWKGKRLKNIRLEAKV